MKSFEMKIEMGAKVRDIVSGYEGIITAYTVHITGCDVVAIKSRALDKDGKTQDPLWVDVTRVQRLDCPSPDIAAMIAVSDAENGREKGGPRDVSQRFSDT
jgi:hypothetical protein